MIFNAIIPIRKKDIFKKNNQELFFYEKSLWEYTIDHLTNSKNINNIFISYDEEIIKQMISKKYHNLKYIKRPKQLSASNKTTLDVLKFSAEKIYKQFPKTTHLLLFEITHPLRPKKFVDQMINFMKENPCDGLITTRKVHYNIWCELESKTFRRLNTFENDNSKYTYEEITGIGSIFNIKKILENDIFGKDINVIAIDKFWSAFDIRDENSFELFKENLTFFKKKYFL